MNTYKTEGVVLKRVNFGEADRVITFYTRHLGKVAAVAKGVRKLSSRKRGSLELFNLVDFFAVRGKGLDVVTEAEAKDTFSSWKKDLRKVSAAYEIVEIVDRLTVEYSEQEEVFELLAAGLKKLEEIPDREVSNLVEEFGSEILILLGFWPREKPFPDNFSVLNYVEQVVERELKSKHLARKL